MLPPATPALPGVYFLLDHDGEVLYVGKATNLRRRLADHARSERWRLVASVRYEVLDSAAAALAREADILAALRPPWNRAHVDDYFSYVTVTDKGLTVGPAGTYGCFPHLGKGALSEPGRACIDGFDALSRIVKTTSPERRLVHDFLTGRSDRLLRAALEIDQPHIAHGVRRDRLAAKGFYDAGPRAIRTLRLRHGGAGRVTQDQFVAWITEEVRAVLAAGPERRTRVRSATGCCWR
jgi:predicted GIY-YIG superfamily endonuclease